VVGRSIKAEVLYEFRKLLKILARFKAAEPMNDLPGPLQDEGRAPCCGVRWQAKRNTALAFCRAPRLRRNGWLWRAVASEAQHRFGFARSASLDS